MQRLAQFILAGWIQKRALAVDEHAIGNAPLLHDRSIVGVDLAYGAERLEGNLRYIHEELVRQRPDSEIVLLLERYEEKDRELSARLQAILTNALRIAEIVKQLQVIKNDKVVDYVKGVKMTDLRQK